MSNSILDQLACFYPTRVLCLDDNALFLSSLTFLLGHSFNIVTETNQKNALNILQQSKLQAVARVAKPLENEDVDTLVNYQVDYDISMLYQLVYEPKRHEQFAVVVIDYQMPGMNGIEFCEKIKNFPVKKILLTSLCDHKLAVQAFNLGVIDKFISKTENDFVVQLSEAIKELQRAAFAERSKPIIYDLQFHTTVFA